MKALIKNTALIIAGLVVGVMIERHKGLDPNRLIRGGKDTLLELNKSKDLRRR